jgi:uncharacterized membrane protein (UPF0182 family)
MEETFEQSLQRIFGAKPGQRAAPVTPAATAESAPEKKNLAGQALDHFLRSQEFLKQGNWGGYGEEMKRVEALLKEMQNAR